ncbi:hypothetical protein [Burkholderia gladioli]|uniref:hypothetical protein n=1 Tax=Burkholderia gladioli TaxID=28095 RepID=UPI00163E6396|nr:hypothetical protein [Burkholderia gladioli]
MNSAVADDRKQDLRLMGLYLPAIGAICTLIGIALESAHAFLSWTFRAELAHAVGFYGLFVYMAGAIIELKARGAMWQSFAGAMALAIFVSVPSIYARDWLISHHLTYFAAVGTAMAPNLMIGIPFLALAPVVYRLEVRCQAKRCSKGIELKAWWGYLLLAVFSQIGAFWYELWQQPYVAVSQHLGPRGYIEWGQVVADAVGIWLGYFFVKSVDPTLVVGKAGGSGMASLRRRAGSRTSRN